MAKFFTFSLRLQTLVLLVLIPGLLLSTALFGWSIYQVLYGIIMTGFDQKLYAVSTVTGAFIRGEDHEALFEERSIAAVASAGEVLLGIDPESGGLYTIDPADGGALIRAPVPATAHALATSPESGEAWLVTRDPLALHTFDPETGATAEVAPLTTVPDGLAYDAVAGVLYAGGERLLAIDPATGAERVVEVAGAAGPFRAPAVDEAGNALYLLTGADAAELVRVDLATMSATVVGPLHDAAPAEEAEEGADLLAAAGPPAVFTGLAIAEGALYGVADRLVSIDPATAAVDSTESAFAFRSERHPAYQRYVGPMRRIMARKDITYLYTEKVDLGGRLTYGIDATEGEDHSVIGTAELIADDDVPAMERAMVDGVVRLSDLEEWDAWGLLKTADAPIYRDDGSVAALAAADVDISVILDKTRVALVQVGLVAALTLIIGALVSLMISKRLVSPLTEVKEGALQLAAGSYGHRIADQQLLELRELSESFNSMSEALESTISELSKTNLTLENVRRRRALEVALADPGYQPDPGLPFLIERSEARDGGTHNPSGYVHLPRSGGDRVLVWLAPSVADSPIENLRLRREVAAIARPALAQHGDNWEALSAFLVNTLFPELDGVVLFEAADRSVRAYTKAPVKMAVVAEDGLIDEVDLSGTPSFVVGPREWVVVAATDPLAATESIRRDRIAAVPGTHRVRLHGPRRSTAEVGATQMSVALFGRDLLIDPAESHADPMSAPVVEVIGA